MMKGICLKFASFLPGCLFIAGCQTLPVVPHAINCDVSAEMLASKCAKPVPITNDATYATLVDAMQADRKALQECGITGDAIRGALIRCNRATDEYNKKIDAINNKK
jgi:hypothetical protein